MNIHVDAQQLRRRCQMTFEQFAEEDGARVWKNKEGEKYIFIDRGHPILAVAHLDSVTGSFHFSRTRLNNRMYIFNRQLDDRLGVHIILDLLPELGIECDVLLTEGEEECKSTAGIFVPPKKRGYNWAFQFDRAGMDVVMYQYEDDDMNNLLKQYGLKVGIGSYSDISDLDLPIKMFNFGCGYYDNHGELSHCLPDDTSEMIGKFYAFWRDNKDTPLPHDKAMERTVTYSYTGKYLGQEYTHTTSGQEQEYEWCDVCGRVTSIEQWMNNRGMCPRCVARNGMHTKTQKEFDLTSTICEVCGKPITYEQYREAGTCSEHTA